MGGAPFGPPKTNLFYRRAKVTHGIHGRVGTRARTAWSQGWCSSCLKLTPWGHQLTQRGRMAPGHRESTVTPQTRAGQGSDYTTWHRGMSREKVSHALSPSLGSHRQDSHTLSSRPPVEAPEVISARVRELNSGRRPLKVRQASPGLGPFQATSLGSRGRPLQALC